MGAAIVTKFAPPYSILFMTELEEEIIKESEDNRIYDGVTLTYQHYSHNTFTLPWLRLL